MNNLLAMCVESDWPSSQTFHSSERRHRGLLHSFPTRSMTLRVVTDQQGHNNEMKMSAEKCATQIPFTLSQCGVPTLEKCGSMCELCTVMCAREKCASARVQVGVVSTWHGLKPDSRQTGEGLFSGTGGEHEKPKRQQTARGTWNTPWEGSAKNAVDLWSQSTP